MTNGSTNDSLVLEGNLLTGSWASETWRLRLSDIVAIAEVTLTANPFATDYYLVFLSSEAKEYCVSIEAAGLEETLRGLKEALGVTAQLDLANSVDFQTRVLWPSDLVGQPFYQLRSQRRSGFLGRFLQRLFPTSDVDLSDPIRRLLEALN